MQFEKTLTCRNLAASFAGECQAGMRYQMIARAAMQQGCEELAGTIKTIAKNETVHARKFFEVLTKHGGTDMDNIEICSGYPFHTGDIGRALRLAAVDERSEHRKIYPAFAETAAADCIKKAHRPPAAGQSVQFFYNLPEWRDQVFNFCTGAGARETPFLNLIL